MTELTEAEIERLTTAGNYCQDPGCACGGDPRPLVDAVAAIIDARLAPIRAVAEMWDTGCAREVLAALDAASADLTASQGHDGTEGQGEGERAGEDDPQASVARGAVIAVVAETVNGNRVLWMTERQAIALYRIVGDAVWGE